MNLSTLDGSTFTQMILQGAKHLKKQAKTIDALNVFPVPDGDTGTNMNLSMSSGVEEVKQITSENVSHIATAFSRGLLMGARGNSGVILSQIFRGFAKGIENKESLTAKDFAEALDSGVDTAYKAVMKPVEGTILTVANDAAKKAVSQAKHEENIITLMENALLEAKASLKRTPDLLPVLKEVGVVDSGGQGLVAIYEGFLAALKGEHLPDDIEETIDMEAMVKAEHHKIAQDFMSTSDIEYGYCTEFMVKFEKEKMDKHPFDEEKFRRALSNHGDSLLVVADEEVVKVHIHTEYPGEVMTMAQRYGSLLNIDIENMREQHTSIVNKQARVQEKANYAIITVSMGSGIKSLFESLGANVVIEGGQTMNPSTKDITNAINEANADNILILPNNKNILMAAEQAAEIAEENIEVIPTTTIPQGISSMLVFHPEASIEENKLHMTEAIDYVKTGQVTYAIRDTKINGLTIQKGHFMGIADGHIKTSHKERDEALKQLIAQLIDDDDEILTILYGEDVNDSDVDSIVEHVEAIYDDLEIEVHRGDQPIYAYILSVE